MARIRPNDIFDHLNPQLRAALDEAVEKTLPGVAVDKRQLYNELEFIRGEVYANVWQTDRIARIDPQTGRVTAWIDLTGLKPPQTIELVPRAATFLPLVTRS